MFLKKLAAAHEGGRLRFFGDLAHLADARAFARHLDPLRDIKWVVYAKAPFAGPAAVLAYLSRYTHRVAISNSRLIALDDKKVNVQRHLISRKILRKFRADAMGQGKIVAAAA